MQGILGTGPSPACPGPLLCDKDQDPRQPRETSDWLQATRPLQALWLRTHCPLLQCCGRTPWAPCTSSPWPAGAELPLLECLSKVTKTHTKILPPQRWTAQQRQEGEHHPGRGTASCSHFYESNASPTLHPRPQHRGRGKGQLCYQRTVLAGTAAHPVQGPDLFPWEAALRGQTLEQGFFSTLLQGQELLFAGPALGVLVDSQRGSPTLPAAHLSWLVGQTKHCRYGVGPPGASCPALVPL